MQHKVQNDKISKLLLRYVRITQHQKKGKKEKVRIEKSDRYIYIYKFRAKQKREMY